VVIDSEQKAVKLMRSSEFAESIPESNIVVDKPGRGSNWAYGFYDKARHSVPIARPDDHQQQDTDTEPSTASSFHRHSTSKSNSRQHVSTPTKSAATSASTTAPTTATKHTKFTLPIVEHQDPCLLERGMEAIRHEAGRCDLLCGFVVIHSLAGGTGSGLGSRITQELRNEYQREFILSVVVAPLQSGETALQNYNAVLCLSVLNEFSDAILLLENDVALRALSEAASTTTTASSSSSTASSSVDRDMIANTRTDSSSGQDAPQVTLNDINQYFARGLACLLSPMNLKTMSTAKSVGHRRIELWDICANITAVPGCKFFQMYSITTRKDSTSTILDLFNKMQKSVPKRIGDAEQVLLRLCVCVCVCVCVCGYSLLRAWFFVIIPNPPRIHK
jgi:hypothetical protein